MNNLGKPQLNIDPVKEEKDLFSKRTDPTPSQIVLNRIKTPDGTILTSWYRHDYNTHKDKNGETYMVDGGLNYLRRNSCKTPFKELSIYSDAPFEEVRESFHRGSRGEDGDEELTYIRLSKMTDEHLTATIEYLREENMYQEELEKYLRNDPLGQLYFKEIEYRKSIKKTSEIKDK